MVQTDSMGDTDTMDAIDRVDKKEAGGVTDKPLVTIAISKGRICHHLQSHLHRQGVALAFNDRQLICHDAKQRIRWILVKNIDVPIYVSNGVADVGVVGDDIVAEHDVELAKLKVLPFGSATLCLITKPEFLHTKLHHGIRIATKYPNITAQYVENRGIEAQIFHLNGSLELAPIVGLTPYIVDIVESGKTIKMHNLHIVEEIRKTSLICVANIAYYKQHRDRVNEIVRLLSLQAGVENRQLFR